LDAPFLISLPGPDISRKLNELAKLEVIDTTFSNMNSMVRQNNLDITVAQSEQARITEKLVAYAMIDGMESDISIIEAVSEAVDVMLRQEANISTVINQLQAAELVLSRIGDPTDGLRIIDELTVVQKEMDQLGSDVGKLYSVINQLESNQRTLDVLPDTSDAEAELTAIQAVVAEAMYFEDEEFKLAGQIRAFECLHANQTRMDAELKQLETKFHAEMPDVCPLCDK